MTELKALSVRQPWAWAIIHAGKDVENRLWRPSHPGVRFRGPVCIHAARGMTQDEYEEARSFMGMFGTACPPAHKLLRGGIIGTVEIIDFVGQSESPWFMGPAGLVLANPKPCEFIPARGELGFFNWKRDESLSPPEVSKWMRERPSALL